MMHLFLDVVVIDLHGIVLFNCRQSPQGRFADEAVADATKVVVTAKDDLLGDFFGALSYLEERASSAADHGVAFWQIAHGDHRQVS